MNEHKIACVQHDCDACQTQFAELSRLHAENEEFRKDSDRLDFLECDATFRVRHIVNKWYTRESYDAPWINRKNLREAIDIAMKSIA